MQSKVSLHPNSSEYQGNNVGEEVRKLGVDLRPGNTERGLTAGEVVRD